MKVEPLFEEDVDFDTFSKSDFRAVKVKECVAVPKSKKLLQFTLDDGTDTDRTILSGIHAYYEPEELVGKTLIAITNLPPRAMMGIDSCGMLTAFSIFYAFPAARDIACDNGAAGCRCFQEDVAHAFMIAGKNDTVCFCIKWARV